MGKREKNERRGVRRQFDEREARKQADRMENDGSDQGGDFNIWYDAYTNSSLAPSSLCPKTYLAPH